MLTKTRATGHLISAELLAMGSHPELLEQPRARVEVALDPCDRQETDQFRLTARERDVLCLLAFRQTDAEIADHLSISYRTVTTHVARIIGKLGVRNRRDAATTAARHGLIEM